MKYVLDASVAIKWVLSEAESDRADALRRDFDSGIHELIAPDIFPVECGHVLGKAERKNIIAHPEGEALLADILTSLPQLVPSLPLLSRAFRIATSTRASVYDCLYVALAVEEGCALITADQSLIRALERPFPVFVDLASYS